MVFALFNLCAELAVVDYFLGNLWLENSLRLEACSP